MNYTHDTMLSEQLFCSTISSYPIKIDCVPLKHTETLVYIRPIRHYIIDFHGKISFRDQSLTVPLYQAKKSNIIIKNDFKYYNVVNVSSLQVNNNNNLTNETPSVSVVNLSSLQLTPAMLSLLSKGLNFCPTPGEPDVHLLRRDLDKFHVSLRRKLFFSKKVGTTDQLDSSTIHFIPDTPQEDQGTPFGNTQFKNPSSWCPPGPPNLEAMIAFNEAHLNDYKPHAPPRSNLTPEEKSALAELKHNTEIVIKPADKGSAVVVQNTEDYIKEGYRQLRNPNFYCEVTHDLTETHNTHVRDLIANLVENGEITEQCADYLFIEKARTPHLYLLPKIHKGTTPVPGRPIVSANNSPTERISQLADYFLQPLTKLTKSYVKDTTDFLCKIEEVSDLVPGTILCTIDVTSLYTNIPNQEGIDACKHMLNNHRIGGSLPSNQNIAKLLEYVLTKNNFEFNSKHYLQTGGTAMGTKVAPSFANLFMAHFEEKWVYPYPTKPSLWLRYIDDIFLIWEHGPDDLTTFINYLNECHPTIKFTSETSYTSVNFLDTSVHVNTEGSLYTDLYCKPTDSHNYLLYESAHPAHCKKSLPYSQLLRTRRICSHLDDFDRNALMLGSHFLRRGYPADLIESAIIKVRRQDRDELLHPAPNPEREGDLDRLFVVTTHSPKQNPLRDIIKENWPILGRTHQTSPLHTKEITFGSRRNENLRDLLVRAKLPSAHPQKKPLTSSDPPSPLHVCSTSACRYCPKLDKTGLIHSTSTGRRYFSKKHISCKSNNLIYCITCKTCKLQYVGQTKNRLMDRFQMHFVHANPNKRERKGTQATTPKPQKGSDPIGRHFLSPTHNGINDIYIHIVEFIKAPSNSPPAQQLRDEYERKWIHRLQTIAPKGLNTMD